MTTSKERPLRRWARRLACLVAFLMALYLAGPWLLPPLAWFLDVSEAPRRCDYVFVLGGGAETRPFVAAALVRAGLAHSALVPTVKLSPEVLDGLWPAEHEITRRVLIARGAPAANIRLLPGECASTLDEAHALAAVLKAEPEGTVAVVTHAYHTRRARMLFRRVLGPDLVRVSFVAAPVDEVDPGRWWRSEIGFVLYVNEYLKLVLYSLR